MAIKTIKEESLTALGNAIRIKTGNEALLEFPNGMVNAISGIETSGAIEALDITANGVYNAPEGVDGYNPITVNVPQKEPSIESLSITTNGTYTAPSGTDGYSPVVVDVQPDLENITITANGTYTHDGKDGYDQVVVNVSGGGSGSDIPEEALLITGDCDNRFYSNHWNWFIENYGNQITTQNIEECSNMFRHSSDLISIPFDINCDNHYSHTFDFMFHQCNNLTNIGKIVNARPNQMNYMFANCNKLRYLPEFVNPNFDKIHEGGNLAGMFEYCYSLRQIPEDFLKELWGLITNKSNSVFRSNFYGCYALDEIRGLNPQTGNITSNMFYDTFGSGYRLKDIIFVTQDDGTPYTVNWKSQTIDLGRDYIGYAYENSIILNYNSGITADKEVIDDTTYQALKNDPDWFTTKVEYSRYNHDSAVNTINSLPDTSAFLATNGGTNTITFKGAAGSATDGGAINTLTAEEIAVATAKGWTVSLS